MQYLQSSGRAAAQGAMRLLVAGLALVGACDKGGSRVGRDAAAAPPSDGATGAPARDGGGQAQGRDAGATGRLDGGAASDAGAPGISCTLDKPDLDGLALETVVQGLDELVYAAQAPGSPDWYLVEQTGRVRVWSSGALRSEPFLDLSAEMRAAPDDERGLLSITFAPDYATSGRFYVMGTPTQGESTNCDTVLSFQRSTSDPYRADPATRTTVLALSDSLGNHHGGTVLFGPDGMLYVGTGDGGGRCDDNQEGGSQNVRELFGKILRLDPNNPPTYAASGNPFATGGDPRVLHYGLRNPFRFNFDRATGDLYIGDVGQGTYEEVNYAARADKGLNFGWAAYEGNQSTCGERPFAEGSTHRPPFIEIDRRDMGSASVIGGVVYRGSAIPKLQGVYLFADYYGPHLSAVRPCRGQRSELIRMRKRCDPNFAEPCFPQQSGLNEIAAFIEGQDREIYMAVNRSRLVKVVPAP